MKLMDLLFENLTDHTIIKVANDDPARFNVGPVYQGGSWNGRTPVKVNGRGSLGVGAYFSPDQTFATTYAVEKGGLLVETYLSVHKPLIIHTNHGGGGILHPCIQALVLLGVKESVAEAKVEKVEEQHGYMGKEISTLALRQGYDAIYQYRNGDLKEIVIWHPAQVKMVGGST